MSELKTKAEYFSLFKSLLTKQIDSILIATAYLNNIKASIEANNIDTLQQLIKHNDIPLSQIEEQEKERFSLIESCGYEKNKTGFKQCIKSFDDSSDTLSSLQNSLYKVMDELQTATTVSDLLITKNKNRVKQSLSILTGTTLQKDSTYASNGKSNQDSLTRDLATA